MTSSEKHCFVHIDFEVEILRLAHTWYRYQEYLVALELKFAVPL